MQLRARRRRFAASIVGGLSLAAALAVAPAAQGAPAAPAAPSAPTGGPAQTLAAQPANTRYAREVLERLLQENPEKADVLALGAEIDTTTSISATLRNAALDQPQVEARIAEIYQQSLERASDPGGLAYWTARVRSRALSYENLIVELNSSAEAYANGGGTTGGYVDYVYEHMLDRPADPSGRASWIGRLDGGWSRARFARSFLRSAERANIVVDAGFHRYLLRAGDPGGQAYWAGRYSAGKGGELDLAVSLLASAEVRGSGCGYDAEHCLLPFPSDRYAELEKGTSTGKRISLKPEWMPSNTAGKHIDPVEWNRNDGFSVGQAALTRVPGIDLEETGAAPIDDIASSLDEDAPIVVVNANTGERVAYFAELDANVPDGSPDQLLYIRPATNYTPGDQYVIGLRNLKDSSGAAIAQNARFATELDRVLDATPEELQDYDADLGYGLEVLDEQGVAIDDTLQQAWVFTVASTENTVSRMLHIRDDALGTLGGAAPAFTVDSSTANPRAGVARRVQGTFDVPLYLTGTGQPGAGFKTGVNGLPVRNGTYKASYDCEIPETALTDPARGTVYGHGLFGSLGEVRSGPQAAMVTGHNMVYCATDWIGMADPDVANAATIIQDLSTFNTLPDRSQQGILNTVFLGRLLVTDDGFVSNAAFQNGSGDPVVDTSDLFYDGNSQGAVIGGAYLAVSPDTSAGVLGVAGMNYATLLERSVDFDPFSAIMKTTYPNTVDRVVSLQLMQMLWDRGETNGYAAHLANDRLPGSSLDLRVLIHTALGDHQVATFTAEIEARTAGISVHRPVHLPGRTTDVDEAWNLPAAIDGSTDSALVVWDSGAALAPLGNIPPRTGFDPHSDPRDAPAAQQQKSTFLQTGGTFVDACSGAACTAPH